MRTFALLSILLALAACRPSRPPAPPAPPSTELKIEAETPYRGLSAVAEDPLTTGTRLRLRWTGEAPRPLEDPAFVGLCLPFGQRITARWVAGSLSGKPLRILAHVTTETLPGPALLASPGSVEPSGILRHWPIYHLKLPQDLYELLRRAGADTPSHPPDLELTLDLTWPKPAGVKPTTATLTKGEESWRSVARALVLNPGGLERYRLATPPPAKGIGEAITDPRRLAPGARPWARLEVTTAGLTRLDPDDLLKAGFPADRLRPEAIRIFSHGRPVPLLPAPGPGAPAAMKPGVYFYAEGGAGPYSATRTYWVALGEDIPAARLAALPAPPRSETGLTLAVVRRTAARDIDTTLILRHGEFMAFEGMAWAEAELNPDRPIAASLALPHYVPGAGPLEARLDFFITREDSLGPFRIEVVSDREVLGNFTFLNVNDATRKFTLPAHCVKNGRVDLVLRLISEAPAPPAGEEAEGGFYFDRFQVTYPSATRLERGRLTLAPDAATTHSAAQPLWAELRDTAATTQSATHPLWAELQADDAPATSTLLAVLVDADRGARGLLPLAPGPGGRSGVAWRPAEGTRVEVFDVRAPLPATEPDPAAFDDLTAGDQGTDLLILTHREFMNQAGELKKFHESEGWRTRVVDVQSVYDTFSDGELSPLAIKAFLAWTLRHWRAGAPAHVLLLGDCTSDYLNVTRSEVRNWVPTYSNNRGGETWAADAWYTTLAGEDCLPDVMLGRLSVANEKDAETEVRKTIDYGAKARPGPWRSRVAFVSDDGEYPEVVEDLRRNDTPPSCAVEKVLLNELPLEDNWYLPKSYVERKKMKVSRTATTRILETFRRGVAFLSYHGHGSPNIWTDERIWFGGDTPNSDNQHLAGGGFCAFVINMTCNSGAIDYPQPPWNVCITEDLMRVENGGAIACFVPSGPGVTNIHRELSRALDRSMFQYGRRRFGEVTTLAKALYALGGINPDDLVYMYHLLGDPAVALQLTAHRGRIILRPDAVVPGSSYPWTLTGVEPAAGQFTAELAGGDGHAIGSAGPRAYAGGRIALSVVIPPDAAADPAAVLRVYAWDPDGAADLAVSGRLAIQRPQLVMERVRCGPDGKIAIELSNPGKVPAAGELSVRLLDNVSSRTLGARPVPLAPGAKTKLEFALPVDLPTSGPLVAEAALRLPLPPDDPSVPQVARRRILVSLPDSLDWIRPLSGIDERPNESAVLRVVAAVPASGAGWTAELRLPGDSRLTTQPLQLADTSDSRTTAGMFAAVFTLDPAQLNSALKGATVSLQPPTSISLHSAFRIPHSALDVSRLERRRSALRIVPGSIRARPEHPTDGDTVFIDLQVENAGNLDSEPATVELLGNPPDKNGEPVMDIMQNGPRQILPLAPGRRVPVTLRWDPVDNAGRKTLYANVRPSSSAAGSPEQTRPVAIEVRTKARLEIGKVEALISPREAEHRITIRGEIKNTGQTDARSVLVAFYRSGLPIPENKLGETEIKVIPGGGCVVAVYEWHFDPLRDMVKGTHLPQPTVEVRLKGSAQRLSSVEEK